MAPVGGDLSSRPSLLLHVPTPKDIVNRDTLGSRDATDASLESALTPSVLLCPCQNTVRGMDLSTPKLQEVLVPQILMHPGYVTALCPSAAPLPSSPSPPLAEGQGAENEEGAGTPAGTLVSSRVRLWSSCSDGSVRLWAVDRTVLAGQRDEGAGQGNLGGTEEDEGTRGGMEMNSSAGSSVLGSKALLLKSWAFGTPIESMVVVAGHRLPKSKLPKEKEQPKSGEPATEEEKASASWAEEAYISTTLSGSRARTGDPGSSGPGKGQHKEGRILRVCLRTGKKLPFPAPLYKVLCRPSPPCLVLSLSGSVVACVAGPQVLVWHADNPFHWTKLRHTRQLTCCALSPCGRHVAAGDASGRILIWHDVGGSNLSSLGSLGTSPVHRRDSHPSFSACSSLPHWHSSAVGALSFSPDGLFLLSGGAEAVLVLWQLKTGAQRFLPRLGGPITGLFPYVAPLASSPSSFSEGDAGSLSSSAASIAGLRFVVQCSGLNAVMGVDLASMSAGVLLQGIMLPPLFPSPSPSPTHTRRTLPLQQRRVRPLLPPQVLPPPWLPLGIPAVDPLTGLLLCPARGARVQIVHLPRHGFCAPVATLQVAPRNALHQLPPQQRALLLPSSPCSPSPSSPTLLPEPVTVSHVAFSPDGLSLFTVEVRLAEQDWGAPTGPWELASGGQGAGPTPTLGQGVCLRFWARAAGSTGSKGGSTGSKGDKGSSQMQPGAPSFLLNTKVDNPHGQSGAAVSALAVHPGGALVVTSSSAGGEFKLWCKLQRTIPKERGGRRANGTPKGERNDKKEGDLKGPSHVELFCWRCQSVGSYTGGAPSLNQNDNGLSPGGPVMSAADFSADGSLLAVASELCITLWDPYTCSLLRVLPAGTAPLGPLGGGISSIKFVGSGPDSLLLTASAGAPVSCHGPTLTARSLLSLEVIWTMPVGVGGIVGGGHGQGEREGGVHGGLPANHWAALLFVGTDDGAEVGRKSEGKGTGKTKGTQETENKEEEDVSDDEEEEESDEEAEEQGNGVESEEVESDEEVEGLSTPGRRTKKESSSVGADEKMGEATEQRGPGDKRQTKKAARARGSIPSRSLPRVYPVVAVFQGCSPVPVAAWAVPGWAHHLLSHQQKHKSRAVSLADLVNGWAKEMTLLPGLGGAREGREGGEETREGEGGWKGRDWKREVELLLVSGAREFTRIGGGEGGEEGMGKGLSHWKSGEGNGVGDRNVSSANALEAIFGRTPTSNPWKSPGTPVWVSGHETTSVASIGKALTDTPSHILPSLSHMLPKFWEQVLQREREEASDL